MSQAQSLEKQSDRDASERSIPNTLPPRDPKFTGRSTEIGEIHERLRLKHQVAITQSPPEAHIGLGKSSLAVACGWQFLDSYPGGVFFVNAAEHTLVCEAAKISGPLRIDFESNEWQTAEKVVAHLAGGAPSLIILDGVDTETAWAQARQLELTRGNCHCLITTNQTPREDVPKYEITGLSQEHSTKMLATFRSDATKGEENQELVQEIVEALDGSPLLLTLVGDLMALNSQATWLDCLNHLTKIGFYDKRADPLRRIYALFDAVLKALSAQQRAGMEFAALLPRNNIVTSWLRQLIESDLVEQVASEKGSKLNPGQQIVTQLLSLQILRPQTPSYKTLAMPTLLKARMEERFKEEEFEQTNAMDRILGLTANRVAAADVALSNATFRFELTALVEHVKELPSRGLANEGAEFANQLALVLHHLSRHIEAQALVEVFLQDKVASSLDPTIVASLLAEKAVTRAAQGELELARASMERAIQIEQEHLVANDPMLATHYSNFAGILKSLGELGRARQYIEQAIEIEKQRYSTDHPTLGLRFWWLGDIELDDGQPADALKEYERALTILQKHYAENHAYIQKLTQAIQSLQQQASKQADTEQPDSNQANSTPRKLDLSEAISNVQPDERQESRQKPGDETLAVKIKMFVTGHDLTDVTTAKIHAKVNDFHRQHRSLKVFHVHVDQTGAAPVVEVKTWGTRKLDRGELAEEDADFVEEGTAQSVLVALDAALESIQDQRRADRTKELVPPPHPRFAWQVFLYAGIVSFAAASLAFALVYGLSMLAHKPKVIEESPVEKQFRSMLTENELDPEIDTVFIPLDLANSWYAKTTDEVMTNDQMIAALRRLGDEGRLLRLNPDPIRLRGTDGYGLLWRGNTTTKVDYSLIRRTRASEAKTQ